MATWLAWAWRDRRARAARHAGPDSLQARGSCSCRPRRRWSPRRGAGGSPPRSRSARPPGRTGGRPWCTWPGRLAGTGGCAATRRSAPPAGRRDQAAAELADKTRWHQILPRAGLGGWHVQWRQDTNLGEERLITTSPENALATRVAGNSSAIAEKLAHILGLPYGRIDLAITDYPGELIIGIRTVDLSVRDAAYHPMTTPWPDAEPSPFADWFGEAASIRDPMIWGFCPEDGSALTMQLFSAIGGRAVGVIGMTGSGKSNLLNDAREHVTRCTDARLVQLNGAHMGDELTWEPLSALTVCGPVATDRDRPHQHRRGAVRAVPAGHQPVSDPRRAPGIPPSSPPRITRPSVVIIDEVDEIVAHVPGAGQALEFLASKQRKSAVALLLATQRAVVAALGGGAVRANMSEVLVGKVARATESRHASGAEKDIPDIREYARGAPGYFQRWDPHSGHGHRAGPGVPARQAPRRTRLHQTARRRPGTTCGTGASRTCRRWPWTAARPPPAATGATTAQISRTMRARLASITQAATRPAPPRPPPRRRLPGPAGRSRRASRRPTGRSCCASSPRPDGVTAAAAGQAIGKSKSRAADYLKIFERPRDRRPRPAARPGQPVATLASRAPARPSRPQPEPAPARAGGYVTDRGPRRRGPRRPGRRRRRHPGGAGTGPPDQRPGGPAPAPDRRLPDPESDAS